ncbi:MAG: type II toxin-antitoxin system VapC family toxin [Rhodocyclaceae bacterium]|jgi:predicted nucleic acid-binding protein|nr:type II toxin-antitoxin system VapC family toxin [Rhodocyclaceae bacterium]
MYLIDTNVISELRKGNRANPGVRAFFAELASEDVYLAVQTVGEIRRGLERIRNRGDREQAERLEAWLDELVAVYSDRILGFDLDCAQVWGRLMSPHPQHAIDKQIAAIALIYDLTVVTRNTGDFCMTGVRTLNPFTQA